MGLTARPSDRWIPWAVAVVAATSVYAVAVAVTGGFKFSLGTLRFSSHSWERPAALALIGAAALTMRARGAIARYVGSLATAVESMTFCRMAAVAAGIWTLAVGIGFGTFASGGADSYGYVGQARLLAHGRLTDAIPVSADFAWPNVDYTFTPLGFTKGTRPGVIAPIYPPGFPLLLAPFSALSEHALYIVVPLFGVLLIWMTYRVGALCGDPLAGGVAALLLAVSPTFLYQVVQPMSDVPCAACWMTALVLASRGSTRSAIASGAVSSLAILIRPNLAPLAAIVLALTVASRASGRMRRAGYFIASIAPGLAVLGWIQDVRYGSPLASGYGRASEMFSLSNVSPNLARYPRWITESHTPFIWVSLAAPFWIVRRAAHRPLAWASVLFAAAVWFAYLPYVFFQPNEWFYTRFLLPAIAVMLVFSSAVALSLLRLLSPLRRVPLSAVMVIGVAAACVMYAERQGAFDIHSQEQKYPRAGEYVRTRGPANAIVLAAQHSGSIRYYANRPTLRWDLLSPTRLDQALATFRAQGFEPVLVVDVGEYESFRNRFAASHQHAVEQLTPLAVLGDARVFGFGDGSSR
jgi:hypothetical protein